MPQSWEHQNLREKTQVERWRYAQERNISCFRCGRGAELPQGSWRAVGYSKVHGHWGLCWECFYHDRVGEDPASSRTTAP